MIFRYSVYKLQGWPAPIWDPVKTFLFETEGPLPRIGELVTYESTSFCVHGLSHIFSQKAPKVQVLVFEISPLVSEQTEDAKHGLQE